MPRQLGRSFGRCFGALFLLVAATSVASAHDIWLEATANVVRTGEWISLNLMLGNHGNQHRDFRLAGKVMAGDQRLLLIDPKGNQVDLTPSLVDRGYTPQEGFWSARAVASMPGLYTAVSTFDKVMSYAPVRDIKCAKTFFVASKSLDRVPEKNPGFGRRVGAPLELVPVVNPITPFGPGSNLRVRLLFKGKPYANAKVSFIPRGAELKGEIDPTYERTTNANGEASLTLKEANPYLVVAHVKDATAKGEGYDSINYSATLTLIVPATCPCCK